MLDLEQYQIEGSTAREIASSVEAAVREGALETGEKLPTVRELARRLGTSPATVNSAYRSLRGRGLVIAEGRRGTRVAPRPPLSAPERPSHGLLSVTPPPGVRDLTIGLPDPELLHPSNPRSSESISRPSCGSAGLTAPTPSCSSLLPSGSGRTACPPTRSP